MFSVTDTNGNWAHAALTVNVQDKVDETPVFAYPLSDNSTVETIDENDEVLGSSLSVTLNATDADTGDNLTYAIVSQSPSTNPAKFEIVSGTTLQQTAIATFDYEDSAQRSYSIIIR